MFAQYFSEYKPIIIEQTLKDLSYENSLPYHDFNIPMFYETYETENTEDDNEEDSEILELRTNLNNPIQQDISRISFQDTTNQHSIPQSNNGLTRESIINYAQQYFNKGYKLGARRLGGLTDCSGWTQLFYKNNFGIDVGSTTVYQKKYGTEVKSINEALPGDLIIMSGGGPNKMHVGLYIGRNEKGEPEMIDSSSRLSKYGHKGISIRNVPISKIKTIRRVLNNKTTKAKKGTKLVFKPMYIKLYGNSK